jgi:hypothetical protein
MDAGAGPSEPPAELNAARKKTAALPPRKLVIKAFKGARRAAAARWRCSKHPCAFHACCWPLGAFPARRRAAGTRSSPRAAQPLIRRCVCLRARPAAGAAGDAHARN